MKYITAIMIDYTEQSALNHALNSLKQIDSSLESIIVIQATNKPLNIIDNRNSPNKIQSIPIKENDFGKTLNQVILGIESLFILFLHDKDYLSPNFQEDVLQISDPYNVLVDGFHNKNIKIHRPLLILSSLLNEQPFLSSRQIPFKEAFFPAWLSNIDSSSKFVKDNLLRQGKKNNSANTIEKQKFIQKYQLEKKQTKHPSLSIIIANYNMEKYVETAIVSCLLQSVRAEEILIMDDGSTDNSLQILERWNGEQGVVVFDKKNGGKARALNDLVPLVTSEFILELDADDWLDPDAISSIKDYLSLLQEDVSVLYGNLRKWKQLDDDVLFKGISKGKAIKGNKDFLTYRFPLGPRIYRSSSLREIGGFPVIEFENGRLYEDVSVLNQLLKISRFCYQDFTVYNVREHKESITRNNLSSWRGFLKSIT